MPVVIKDFEVVGNGRNTQEPAAPAPAPQPATKPISAHQVAQLMEAIKQRAKRLHAD